MTFDQFRKDNAPAFGENERDYFLRLSYELSQFNKHQARQNRKQRWMNRLTTITKALVIRSNPLHVTPA